jgi:hypothetical protein
MGGRVSEAGSIPMGVAAGAGARHVLAPVAGIPIVHEMTGPIAFAPTLDWTGSQEFDDPVTVHHRVAAIETGAMRRLFDASPSCSYFQGIDGVAVEFRGPSPGVPDQLLMATRPGYTYELRYAQAPGVPMFQRAKDRTIFSMALAHRGRGYIAHACGFVLGDAGVLCPGLPSAGKSTLARLLGHGNGNARVERLSDDRIAVTREAAGFRIWGTPWPGDERVIGAGDAPLGAIVFLRHGQEPGLMDIAPGAAARRLLETLVLPVWDRALLPAALGFVDSLVRSAPTLEFAYPPTARAIDWLLEELARRGLRG